MRREWVAVCLMFFVLSVFIGISSATPDLVVDVIPIKDVVAPGEYATYTINVTSKATITEHVVLSILNQRDRWNYTFSPDEFDIEPGETVLSTLSIGVPSDASPGDYYHDVKASGQFLGVEIEKTVYTNVLTSVIPEFSTIAIPAAAIFILLFFIRRRRA